MGGSHAEREERRARRPARRRHRRVARLCANDTDDVVVGLSFVTASYTPARHILPLLPELPGSGDTALVNSVAYSRIHWKYFQKVGEYKGVKLLGVFTHGPGQMFTKKPVR